MGRPKGSKNKKREPQAPPIGAQDDEQQGPRQQVIPGTDADRIKALDDIAAEFHEIRTTRIELSARESKLQARSLDAMHEAGVERYRSHQGDVDYDFDIESTEKVKIKKVKVATAEPPAATVTVEEAAE